MPKGDRPNRFKIIPKEDVKKEIALGKEMKSSARYNFNDITGQNFSDENITVVGRYREQTTDGKPQWICKCNLCGNYFYTNGKNLRNGRTKSCGCLVAKKCAERNKKFNIDNPKLVRKLYKLHFDIIRKCYDSNRREYKYAGAKGIYVDPEWYTPDDPNNTGFINFYNWMIDHGYSLENKQIVDRIDRKGPYAPWNCVLRLNTEQWRDMMSINIHNMQFESSDDAAYFDEKRGEYVDKDGFIHLVGKVTERRF